jgi:hypothetical protein
MKNTVLHYFLASLKISLELFLRKTETAFLDILVVLFSFQRANKEQMLLTVFCDSNFFIIPF